MCFAFLASGDCEQPAKAKMSVRLTAIMLIVWRVPIAQTSCKPRISRPCTMPPYGVLGNATEVGGLKQKRDARMFWASLTRRPDEAGLRVISCGGAEAGI